MQRSMRQESLTMVTYRAPSLREDAFETAQAARLELPE
jgi:hypothetical protein